MNASGHLLSYINSHASQLTDCLVAGGIAFIVGFYIDKLSLRKVILDVLICVLIVIEMLTVLMSFHFKGVWVDASSLLIGVVGKSIVTKALTEIFKHKPDV